MFRSWISIASNHHLCFNPSAMSKVCDLCGKTYLRGKLVARGIGDRVTRRTTHHQKPNLRSKKVMVGGTPMKLRLCASCLKKLKKVESLAN